MSSLAVTGSSAQAVISARVSTVTPLMESAEIWVIFSIRRLQQHLRTQSYLHTTIATNLLTTLSATTTTHTMPIITTIAITLAPNSAMAGVLLSLSSFLDQLLHAVSHL
jgi:hypothetical protein